MFVKKANFVSDTLNYWPSSLEFRRVWNQLIKSVRISSLSSKYDQFPDYCHNETTSDRQWKWVCSSGLFVLTLFRELLLLNLEILNRFASYVFSSCSSPLILQTTVIEYVKPSDLKKDMNETFREKFPHVTLTLSKIRRYALYLIIQTHQVETWPLKRVCSSLKREMTTVGEDCGLQPVAIAMALVYFEKLVLQGRLNKQNRLGLVFSQLLLIFSVFLQALICAD